MRFSQTMERSNKDLITAVLNSPFVRQLADGTLDRKIFDYYITQDLHHLNDFVRTMGICTSKAKDDDLLFFIQIQSFAYRVIEERNSFYASEDGFTFSRAHSPGQLAHSAFILRLALQSPIEVAFAGALPSPWLHAFIGSAFGSGVPSDHPYHHWLTVNAGENLASSLETYKSYLDRCAEEKSALYHEMTQAVRQGFLYMYHFWEDAYLMKDAGIL